MKALTTVTAIAALIAGISFANAQNATTPNDKTSPPPSSINAGTQAGTNTSKSGMQSSGSAAMKSGKASGKMAWKGNGKFCITQTAGGLSADCKFASMQACETAAKPKNLNCYAKGSATTGMKSNEK